MNDITVEELKVRMEEGDIPILIDVREPDEHEQFNIGGQNLPLGGIVNWSDRLEFSPDSEVVVYCRSGNRSAMAKSYLTSRGFTAVRNLIGGMVAWSRL